MRRLSEGRHTEVSEQKLRKKKKKSIQKIKVLYKNGRINIKYYTKSIKPTKKIKNTVEESTQNSWVQ